MSEPVVDNASKRPAVVVSSPDLPTRSCGVSVSKRKRQVAGLLRPQPKILSRVVIMHEVGDPGAIDDPFLNWRNVKLGNIKPSKTQAGQPNFIWRWLCSYAFRHKCNVRDLIGSSKP